MSPPVSAAQASVSLVNNGGDIGKTLQDLGSSTAIKNTLAAMITAGVGTSLAGQGVTAVAAQTAGGETYQSLVGYAANAGPGDKRNGAGQSTQTYVPNEVGRQKIADQGMGFRYEEAEHFACPISGA